MVNAANDVDLSLELPLSLSAPRLELLYCDLLPIGENSFVHVPKSSLPQQVSMREPVGRSRELFVAEGALVEGEGDDRGGGWQWRTMRR